MEKWTSERASANLMCLDEWSVKRVLRLNEPPHEYWDKQEFLAQRRPTNWIHLSPLAVRETRYSSLRPHALHRSASPRPCSSPPPTYDTNTTPSHNARDYHDNHNNGSAWDKRVCGTPGQLKYLRDCWMEKTNKFECFCSGSSCIKIRAILVCQPIFFLRQSLKTVHLEESDECFITNPEKNEIHSRLGVGLCFNIGTEFVLYPENLWSAHIIY